MRIPRSAWRLIPRPVRRAWAWRRWIMAAFVLSALGGTGFGSLSDVTDALPVPGSLPGFEQPSPSTVSQTDSQTTVPQAGFPSTVGNESEPAVALLARLAVEDNPRPGVPYRRELWPHWEDPERDGCDARDQALKSASHVTVRVSSGCDVVAGQWVSDYDGQVITEARSVDVDHVVALGEAHRSGGWAWSTEQRMRFANDQRNLWVVSAASNRAKSDKRPDKWRPPRKEVWCVYASRWVSIKVEWGLTVTTPERDALGAMLETCP